MWAHPLGPSVERPRGAVPSWAIRGSPTTRGLHAQAQWAGQGEGQTPARKGRKSCGEGSEHIVGPPVAQRAGGISFAPQLRLP
eukprot:2803240-Pyramimonas_sp.AAC.1